MTTFVDYCNYCGRTQRHRMLDEKELTRWLGQLGLSQVVNDPRRRRAACCVECHTVEYTGCCTVVGKLEDKHPCAIIT